MLISIQPTRLWIYFRRSGILMIFCLFFYTLSGQKDKRNIKFDNISIKDGLSQSSPNCILQDSHGVLWIGTEDGLNKYDGYTFQVFKPEQGNENCISNPRILSLYEDDAGILWVGTNGGGLNSYDPVSGRFMNFLPDSNDSASLAGKIVYSILGISQHQLWIGTEGGLSVIDLKTRTFQSPSLAPVTLVIQDVAVTAISSGAENTVWIGTEKGLYRYVPETNTHVLFTHNPADPLSIPDNSITALLFDKNQDLWVGTGNGLAKMKSGSDVFTRFNRQAENNTSGSYNHIKALLEDDYGNIWVGTFGGGLDLISAQTGEFFNMSYDYNNPYSLSNNEVLSLYRDFSGIIWVGTNGLDKYNPNKEKFVLYDYVPYTREKLMFRNIHPIYEDNNGILWIGSKTDGLHILDRRNENYHRIIHQPGNTSGLSSSRIRAIQEYPEGVLWIGTDDQGLNRVTLDAGRKPLRFQHYSHIPGEKNSLTSNKIYAIYPDNNGKLWIGTDQGLTLMDIATESFTQFVPDPKDPKSLSNLTVYGIYGDKTGNIWLATDWGVNKFDPATNGFIHYIHQDNDSNSIIYNEILSFHEDNRGNLWIGTYGKGLDKFNIASQTFTHFTGIKELSTAVIYGILEDSSGNLWLSTNNGIIKFQPATGAVNQFSIEDGLQSNEFNGTSYFMSSSGEMFFGGQYGFNSFFPNEVMKDSVPPKIVLADLQVHNKSVIPGENSPIQKQINAVDEITLNYKENNFTLYFSALHFANPASNRYQYKLEGFDNEWIDAGNKRFVSYTSLPYKSYTFRVRASNSDGIWNQAGLSVKIRIKPPFWATLWFRLLAVISLILGLLYMVRKRLSVEKKQKQIFEEKFEASSKELQEAQWQLEKQHAEIVVQKQELKLREKDQENLLWFNQGLGIFSDIMSKYRDDTHELCRVFIEKLVAYVDAQQGGVFLLNEDQAPPCLELVANYAYALERANTRFNMGEGYVGTCCHSQQFIEIDNLTDNYATIRSGLGSESLKHLLLAPMLINDSCIGVIELGSFKKLKGYRVSFIEKLLESFTSILNTQQANAKLLRLIEHSTKQAQELKEREDQLRMNLEEIMATQEESARREDELIKLAEESATHEEMLGLEISILKAKLEEITGKPYES